MRKIELGQLLMTRGVADLQEQEPFFGGFVTTSLMRYVRCDWGDLGKEDAAMNDSAIGPDEDRVFAAYEHPKHPDWKIWIITEADRSATTVLFPSEY